MPLVKSAGELVTGKYSQRVAPFPCDEVRRRLFLSCLVIMLHNIDDSAVNAGHAFLCHVIFPVICERKKALSERFVYARVS